MIKIGLTGGIGSGKTSVSKIFKDFGVPVFNSDQCARDAENNPIIRKEFQRILGNDIIINDHVDRVKMRSVIFTDKEKMQQINAVVTPYVKAEFELFCESNTSTIVMLESAILFELGADKGFDYIITVTADEDIRINRVLKREKTTLEDIKNKLNNQWPESEKKAKSNFIIYNNGLDLIDSIDELTKQAKTIIGAVGFLVLNKLINDKIIEINTNGKV